MSRFAFGTYRISEHNPVHIAALREAVLSGVKLINTSSNYMDGSSERAIALALGTIEDVVRDDVEIISKFGYIQGQNMQLHKKSPFSEVVEYDENCFHSIHKDFLKDQLSLSLQRLQMNKISCYLLHNPEYYILDAIKRGIDKDEMLDTMYKRIYDAFVALEGEVKNGRIDSYGISSNSFALKSYDAEFLPYEDLITLAQNAALEAANEKHSLTTIELPINLSEQEGFKCAAWAKNNGLKVLANRPLNAQYNGKMYRLASYDESTEYYHHLNELIDICDNDVLRSLYNLLEQLDSIKHKFGFIGDYETFLYSQIIPHMKKALEVLSEEDMEPMLNFIDLFLIEYKKMVAYECSLKTKIELQEFFGECFATMQECALKFLLENNDIDYILVGMRKPSYVADIMSIETKL